MRHCWQFRPEDRPSFRELIDWLEAMLQDDTEYLDLTPNAVSNASYLQPITTKGKYVINLKRIYSNNFFTETLLRSVSCSPSMPADLGSSSYLRHSRLPAAREVSPPAHQAPSPPKQQQQQQQQQHRRRHHLEADKIKRRRREEEARGRSRTVSLPLKNGEGNVEVRIYHDRYST